MEEFAEMMREKFHIEAKPGAGSQAVNQGVNQAQMAPPPPPPAGPTYFLAVNGQRQGPFDAQTLQQMAMQGTFTAATMVWTAGMAGWQAANTVPALATLFAAVPPPLP